MRSLGVIVMAGVLAMPISARADEPRRVMLAVGGAVFASYPMSLEDPGPAAVLATPFWLGERHRFFQWVLDGDVLVGFGTASNHGHVAVMPQAGVNLYIGSVFGFELRVGPAGIVQVGARTVGGLGLAASGGYVFRFWDDDRRRLKLLMIMQGGGYLADDPGNDLGMNAGAFGVGVAYEAPL